MKKGIEFTFINGDKDWYDPVDEDNGLKIIGDVYSIDNGYCKYTIKTDVVKSIRWYDLCPICGSEMYEDGCHRYHEDKE